MADTLPDYKRRALEEQLRALLQEYTAANQQLNATLSAVDRTRIERLIADLERQIEAARAKLGVDPASDRPEEPPPIPPKPSPEVPDPPDAGTRTRKVPIWAWYFVVVLLGLVLGVVTDLMDLLGLLRCTALWLAAALALISGLAILGFSSLPDQKSLHTRRDRIILVILTLIVTLGLALFTWRSCPPPPEPALVTLRTFHGTFVTALNGNETRDWSLRGDATDPKEWERYSLICLDDGTAVLKSSHRKYVTATADDGWILRAATEEYPESTKFTLLDLQTEEKLPCSDVLKQSRNDEVNLALEIFPDRFVTAKDANGDWIVIAEASEIKEWEEFTVTAP